MPHDYDEVNDKWKSIPYGYPLRNQEIYILNYKQDLCPIGIEGEIYIAGRGLAKGYINDKEKTDQAFINHKDLGPLYRTGDYGLMTKEGYVEFRGRRDFQVKISGHRIELGEIENVIKNYEGIENAVTRLYEKNGKTLGICAYYILEDKGHDIDEVSLLKYCEQYITPYMIPKHLMELDEIPLNINGKVDKKALPLPNMDKDESKIHPRNEVEKLVHSLWAKELEISNPEELGIDDSFFEMGGDSVKAIRIYSSLRENYAINIRDIFDHQTIRSLAEYLKDKETKDNFITSQINEIRTMYKESLLETEIEYDCQKYMDEVLTYVSEQKNTDKEAYTNILLTGATGYLGTHVLYEFLQHTQAHLSLIIRGNNIDIAAERLRQKLIFYHDTDVYMEYKDRISIFLGDLTKENLGVDTSRLKELLSIDCIVNTAAKVLHFSSYEDMYAQNVQSVKHLVDLSKKANNIPIYHISSSQVASGSFDDDSIQCICGECDNIQGQHFDDFYSQTKYEAEQVLFKNKEQALPISIIRLGNVVFQSGTGKFQENMQDNAFYSLLRLMLLVDQVPQFKEKVLEFTFVDKVAEIIRLVVTNKLENVTLHAVNPNKTSLDFFADSLLSEGLSLESVSYDSFLDTLEKHCQENQEKAYVQNVIANKDMLTWHKKTQVHFVSEASDLILEKLGFVWPKVDEAMIRKMYKYAVKNGYFPEAHSDLEETII